MIPRELKVLHTAIAAQVLQNYIVDMKAENWFTGVFKNFVNNFLLQDLIDAYFIDQKSMIGVAKKVHKHNKEKS